MNEVALGKQQPNVIVIMPHDLGDYLGCYGYTVKTPNIDRLAGEGVRFDNHFSTSPICSPARGSIITGKYPHTSGLLGLCNFGWDLPKSNITDAQRFADAGYHTYLLGRQHEKRSGDDLGFDFRHCFDEEMVTNNYGTDIVAGMTEEVLQKIDMENKAAGTNCRKPFYIRLGMFDVHRGNAYTGNYYGWDWAHDVGIAESEVKVMPKWKDTNGLRYDLAGFTGAVKNLDRGIGKVMDAVEKYGFENNTIIVFTADHGMDFPACKGFLYDPGLRTPLIIRYPQHIKQGTVIGSLSSHIDILPTLLDLCDIDSPGSVQGASLVPLMTGETEYVHEKIFAEGNTFPMNIMRCIRNERFKLIRNFNPGLKSKAFNCSHSRTVLDTGEFYFFDQPQYELYDLINDPHEMNNLAGTESYEEIEDDLRTDLEKWMHDTGDYLPEKTIRRPVDEYVRATRYNLPDEHNKTVWPAKCYKNDL